MNIFARYKMEKDQLIEQLKVLQQAVIALEPDTAPHWGTMTAQAMLEHLTLGLKIGNGTLKPRGEVPYHSYDDARKRQIQMMVNSTQPFARNIMNPLMKDKPFQTRKANLEEAKHWFLEELSTLFEYWDQAPDAMPLHPTLGEMNMLQWLNFERKHIAHHFAQFGLVAESAD